eukprot:28774_1
MSFKTKKIKDWTNEDVLEWISTIGLTDGQLSKALEGIKESECVGKDWFGTINSKKDVQSELGIKSSMIAKKVYNAYKELKKDVCARALKRVRSITELQPSESKEPEFQLSLFGQSKYWAPKQQVTKNTTIADVCQIYKNESGVISAIEEIGLINKTIQLAHEKTLGFYGITNERHSIHVKFRANGGIYYCKTQNNTKFAVMY